MLFRFIKVLSILALLIGGISFGVSFYEEYEYQKSAQEKREFNTKLYKDCMERLNQDKAQCEKHMELVLGISSLFNTNIGSVQYYLYKKSDAKKRKWISVIMTLGFILVIWLVYGIYMYIRYGRFTLRQREPD